MWWKSYVGSGAPEHVRARSSDQSRVVPLAAAFQTSQTEDKPLGRACSRIIDSQILLHALSEHHLYSPLRGGWGEPLPYPIWQKSQDATLVLRLRFALRRAELHYERRHQASPRSGIGYVVEVGRGHCRHSKWDTSDYSGH